MDTADLGQWLYSVYYFVRSVDAGAGLLTESTGAVSSPYQPAPGQ